MKVGGKLHTRMLTDLYETDDRKRNFSERCNKLTRTQKQFRIGKPIPEFSKETMTCFETNKFELHIYKIKK